MASKTNTSSQTVFHRNDTSNPNNCAIFTFDTDSTRPGVTQITLPEKSVWTPGPHWHERHIEYFRVIKGRVLIKLGGTTKLVTPQDGPVRVEKFLVHEFMRADWDKPDEKKDPGEVITEEWTDPADGIKHVFFRNIFSTLQDSEKYWKGWTYLQALLTAATYDDYIQVVPGRLSYISTHVLYASVRGVGGILGLRAWHDEYTPESLRTVANNSKLVKTD